MRRSLVFAGLAFVFTIVLGFAVSHGPTTRVAADAFGAHGALTDLATFLTTAGRFPTYAVLCVLSLAFGMARRVWLAPAILAVVGLIAVWQTSDALKLYFARARPLDPILPETSFSYPSGHADLSIFFYGIWAFYVWQGPFPRPVRIGVTVGAVLWIAAIDWSRLALGAHYPTDVFGGVLLGGGWLCIAIFLVDHFGMLPATTILTDRSRLLS